jgi:hypothetical protein
MIEDSLLNKIQRGSKLSVAEKKILGNHLQDTKSLSADHLYEVISALGRGDVKEYSTILERHLDHEDPLIVSLVLEILCIKWDQIETLLERVLHFALGQQADESGDIQRSAIEILGVYLSKSSTNNSPSNEQRKRIIALLLLLLQDQFVDSDTKKEAYFSLWCGSGRPAEKLPSRYSKLDFSPTSKQIDHELLSKLKEETQSVIESSLLSFTKSSSTGSTTGIA